MDKVLSSQSCGPSRHQYKMGQMAISITVHDQKVLKIPVSENERDGENNGHFATKVESFSFQTEKLRPVNSTH